MFLRQINNKNKRGDVRKYYEIVRAVRVNGKPKHESIQYLGALSDSEAQAYRNILAMQKNPNMVVVDATRLNAYRHYSFLELWALHWIFMFFGLHQLFENIRYAELMVLNRCVEPDSKASVFSWAAKTAVPAFLGVPGSNALDFDIYRDLDKMADMEGIVMNHLYKMLEKLRAIKDNTILYDISATYLEGSTCTIAEFGYSSGGKQGHKQIKIALATTRDGFPFYWKVLEGNLGDKKTLPELVSDLRDNFKVKNLTLIFDRGMFGDKNFRAIEMASCTYVTAMPADSLRKLDFSELHELSKITEETNEKLKRDLSNLEDDPSAPVAIPELLNGFNVHPEERVLYRSFKRQNVRYVVVYNPELWSTRRSDRESKVKAAVALTKEINSDFAGAKKSRSIESFKGKFKAILKDLEVDNILTCRLDEVIIKTISGTGEPKEIKSFRAVLEQKEEYMHLLECYDGLYCITTDLPEDKMSDEEVILAYRKRSRIEDAFRTIKSDIKLRPVFVRQEKRIKGHVMVCVLAYLLDAFIEYRMKINNSSHKKACSVLKILSECTIDEYKLPGKDEKIRTLTMLTEKQLELLKYLGLQDILKANETRPILESKNYLPGP
ncbi:MAG: IS1634 family transposase, partial [Thermodesulfovibrionales bacterium]